MKVLDLHKEYYPADWGKHVSQGKVKLTKHNKFDLISSFKLIGNILTKTNVNVFAYTKVIQKHLLEVDGSGNHTNPVARLIMKESTNIILNGLNGSIQIQMKNGNVLNCDAHLSSLGPHLSRIHSLHRTGLLASVLGMPLPHFELIQDNIETLNRFLWSLPVDLIKLCIEDPGK